MTLITQCYLLLIVLYIYIYISDLFCIHDASRRCQVALSIVSLWQTVYTSSWVCFVLPFGCDDILPGTFHRGQNLFWAPFPVLSPGACPYMLHMTYLTSTIERLIQWHKWHALSFGFVLHSTCITQQRLKTAHLLFSFFNIFPIDLKRSCKFWSLFL